jgi:hypothetical protein
MADSVPKPVLGFASCGDRPVKSTRMPNQFTENEISWLIPLHDELGAVLRILVAPSSDGWLRRPKSRSTFPTFKQVSASLPCVQGRSFLFHFSIAPQVSVSRTPKSSTEQLRYGMDLDIVPDS